MKALPPILSEAIDGGDVEGNDSAVEELATLLVTPDQGIGVTGKRAHSDGGVMDDDRPYDEVVRVPVERSVDEIALLRRRRRVGRVVRGCARVVIAQEWLREYLKHGPVPVAQLRRDARKMHARLRLTDWIVAGVITVDGNQVRLAGDSHELGDGEVGGTGVPRGLHS